MGMQPDVCYHGAPGHSGAFRPAPGAVSGAGGQGGRRIPEGCIAEAAIRDPADGAVAAAMAEQSQQQRSSDCGQEQRQRPETLRIFLMCTILLPLILLMHDPEIDESGADWQSVVVL